MPNPMSRAVGIAGPSSGPSVCVRAELQDVPQAASLRLRRPARYLACDCTLSDDEMAEMLAVAEEMHAALEASRPMRAPSPSTIR
jgi:hypothetical protein